MKHDNYLDNYRSFWRNAKALANYTYILNFPQLSAQPQLSFKPS